MDLQPRDLFSELEQPTKPAGPEVLHDPGGKVRLKIREPEVVSNAVFLALDIRRSCFPSARVSAGGLRLWAGRGSAQPVEAT
jgi:hypothetical protein